MALALNEEMGGTLFDKQSLLNSYAHLATCPALDSLLAHNHQIFVSATDRIMNDLVYHYDYHPNSFPKDAGFESLVQRRERTSLVSTWMEDLVWDATDLQRSNILTLLFYSVWNIHIVSGKISEKCLDHSSSRRGRSSGKRSQMATGAITNYCQATMPPLGNVDSLGLLIEALQSIKRLDVQKYTELLQDIDETARNLARFVRPDLIRLLHDKPLSQDSFMGNAGDISTSRRGIYVHLLWPLTFDQYDFYVYVGQSNNLRQRIGAHSDIWYRHKHPSLHYHVWDSRPDMKSAFIIFSYADNATETELNLLEFWGCLLFQSLPVAEASKYSAAQIFRSGRGLNVSNPLWQGAPGHLMLEPVEKRGRFEALMRSPDPTIREYYCSLSRAFSDLQHSNNDGFRAYFASLCLRRQAAGSATKTARTLHDLIAGCTKLVVAYRGTSRLVILGNLTIRLLKEYVSVDVEPGMQVHIQGFLSVHARADCYAKDAGLHDPANQLGLKVTYVNEAGKCHSSFIRAGGIATVKDINTLVDQLDGVEDSEIASRPRRRVPLTVSAGRKQYST